MTLARFRSFAIFSAAFVFAYEMALPIAYHAIDANWPNAVGPRAGKIIAFVMYLLVPAIGVLLFAHPFGIWTRETNGTFKLFAVLVAFVTPVVCVGPVIILECYLFAFCI